MSYIDSVANPSGSWLFEYGGDDGDAVYVRCPHCGCVVGLAEGTTAPKFCPSCRNAVSGSDKVEALR